MSLHNGLDTMAIATVGVYSSTYGAAQAANIANLYASHGFLEDAPDAEPVSGFAGWIKKMFDWFWEVF